MSSGLLQVFVKLGETTRNFEQRPILNPEFDKHLKKTGGHIVRNVEEIIIKMKTIGRKPLMIKIIKLRLKNLDNELNGNFV